MIEFFNRRFSMFNLKRSYSLCCVDGLIDTIQRSVSLRSNLSVVTIFRSSAFQKFANISPHCLFLTNRIRLSFGTTLCIRVQGIKIVSMVERQPLVIRSKLLHTDFVGHLPTLLFSNLRIQYIFCFIKKCAMILIGIIPVLYQFYRSPAGTLSS